MVRDKEREGQGNPGKLPPLIPSSIKTTRSRIKRRDYRRRAGKISGRSIKRCPYHRGESLLFSNLHFIAPLCGPNCATIEKGREEEREREREKGEKNERDNKNATITSLPVNSLYYSAIFSLGRAGCRSCGPDNRKSR